MEISNMPPFKFGMLVFGVAQLKLNLGFLGAPNCDLLVTYDIPLPIWSGGGKIVVNGTVPDNPALIGLTLYNQVWLQDPKANRAQIAMSNGAKVIIGK